MTKAGIVIVGAGEAGARAAITLRAEGYDAPLTLIGDERHAPYERPPLSKATIVSEAAPAIPTIGDAAGLVGSNIDHLTSVCVVSIDRSARNVALSNGRALAYDKLLLATGAKPRRLAIKGADAAVYLRNFDDSLALRGHMKAGRRIAIIGGGFIGLELASSACALGCEVMVIEAAPRILMRGVPSAIADIVASRHRAAGVELATGATIAGVSRTGDHHIVTLANGRKIEADCLIAGIGAAPDIALAEAAALSIDNGIAVDGRLRTSDPHIYAAGDCASFPHPLYNGRRIRLEAWRNAFDQGAFAAKSMLGAAEEYQAVPWFWSDQHDLNLQIAGLVDEGRETVARDLGEGALLLFHLTDDGRLAAASAVGPLGKIAREVRLAEMLIARRARPDRQALASPDVKLKSLLAA
ncbi:NAD(P)/FAD-dependent oxidoreductase [Methylocapsa sp. S129]|uniref:NAD(P)/FAD-dependent oxidoreductase n=1 Tax=Methylocapsa sp. S129 TaxID=1641869 RepID=UPI00131AF922|nr:FAD-dependent oxidoreductase [Methylocapsa sp. S129]